MVHGLLCVMMVLVAARTPPDEAVARGREALDHRWSGSYPWYDAEADEVRPIEISKPPRLKDCKGRCSARGSGDGPARRGESKDWDLGWDLGGFSPVVAEIMKWMFWLAVAAILLLVVFFLIRTYARGDLRWAKAKRQPKSDSDEARRIEALPFPVRAAQSDFLAEARRLYQQGQYGEAVKYLFSYQLVQLDKHRVVRLTRGKTNRQYLREIHRRGRRGLVGLFEQTMLAFEDFFFGNHPIDQMRFEACWSRLGEFESQLKGENG